MRVSHWGCPLLGVGAIGAADESYLLATDLVAQFVAEHAHPDPTGRVPASALYTAYCRWCRANGHLPLSGKALAADWERLGYTRRRIHGRSVWHGLKLNISSRRKQK